MRIPAKSASCEAFFWPECSQVGEHSVYLVESGRSRPRASEWRGGIMAKDKGLRPGQTAPKSGQYQQIGPRGGEGKEVTVTLGEPMPPTPKLGMTYNLVDPTKNKSGQGK